MRVARAAGHWCTCVEIGAAIVGAMAHPPPPRAGPLAARNFQVATLPPQLSLLLLLLSPALDCKALALRLSLCVLLKRTQCLERPSGFRHGTQVLEHLFADAFLGVIAGWQKLRLGPEHFERQDSKGGALRPIDFFTGAECLRAFVPCGGILFPAEAVQEVERRASLRASSAALRASSRSLIEASRARCWCAARRGASSASMTRSM